MFAKKGVYHSEMVARTSEYGELQIILMSHPKPSKFKDRPPYCEFKVAGTETPHQYECENATIEQTLAALPLYTVLTIAAHGSRDDARIEVRSGSNGSAPAPQPQSSAQQPTAPRQQPPAQPAAQQQQQQQQYGDARPHAILAQYSECFLAALEIIRRGVEKVPELKDASPDAMLAATKEMASTLFIEWNHSGGTRPLRSGNGNG